MRVSDGEGVLALSESQGVRSLQVWHQKVTCWYLPQVSKGKEKSEELQTSLLPGSLKVVEGSQQSFLPFLKTEWPSVAAPSRPKLPCSAMAGADMPD